MMTLPDIKEGLSQLNKNLEDSAPGILKEFPPEKYRLLIEEHDAFSGYRVPGNAIVCFCAAIREQYGTEALGLYNRNLLMQLIAESKIQSSSFPLPVQNQYCDEFNRIIDEVNINPSTWYSWEEDLFCKDLAICSGRMFPAGCLKTEIHSGIPRRTLLNLAPMERFRFSYLILKLGGFAPFFEIHLDIRYRESLTPAGWAQALRMVGQCLDCFPEAKGITGGSWFFDQEAINISPKLAYLRRQIEDAGGQFFYAGRNDRVVELATSASATRKKLYEEGKYMPASYMTIWPREKVLSWLG